MSRYTDPALGPVPKGYQQVTERCEDTRCGCGQRVVKVIPITPPVVMAADTLPAQAVKVHESWGDVPYYGD